LWSAEIIEEVRGAIQRSVPGADPARVDRMLGYMRAAFPDAMLVGYAHLTPRMTNDAADRHVLAAAVTGHAEVVVTWNVRHFPPGACRPHGITVETPDEFLAHMYVSDPGAVEAALARQVARYVAPPMTVEDLLARHAPRLPHFIAAVRAHRSRRPPPGIGSPASTPRCRPCSGRAIVSRRYASSLWQAPT
jgi:hypothetical protein